MYLVVLKALLNCAMLACIASELFIAFSNSLPHKSHLTTSPIGRTKVSSLQDN